jgi:3'-phosphoadenosine 5'-phosphosulfate sulfotransferase (PAPS reductase)/FAD synthetase
VTDPFAIHGPAVVSFSGGRTSAYMLRRILDAHGGTLPDDVHVVFANTGKERAETLDFVHAVETRWSVPVHWVEYDGRDVVVPVARTLVDGVVRIPHMEVTYATAARNGEPFTRLISERKYLPNAVQRFCTEILKVRAMKRWMLARGHEEWTAAVGLRADEMRRVTRITSPEAERERERETVAVPLARAGITVSDVFAFWRSQPFDLALQSYEGNCDLCFLKGRRKRERIMRERPDLVGWWADMETFVKGRFHAHEPGYAATLERVRRLPMLPMDIDGEDDSIPCTCTD